MPDYYLIIVVLLFILAISDLVVGVSNDAVNFLNSAIGSKVSSRRNIMIVASLGVLLGAIFSSGMMEVARKGIFNPEFFYFSEIMVIFIAVMLTDIILLDLFNTFGMPTSTTVSIVFELLGAAVAISILKIAYSGDSIFTLSDYINTSGALIIISGIFLSIFIAFTIGSLVQYISRFLFTFRLSNRFSWLHYLWCGLSLSALTYFLFVKGIGSSSLIPSELTYYLHERTTLTLLAIVLFWTFGVLLMHKVLKVNILKVVVLFGTFTLAMAFSGNDLVNFIGVPIAGFESFLAWRDSGIEPNLYSMEVLAKPLQSKTYILLLAGIIMIVTLWFSKKARSVTETEVNLGRQAEGEERFKPSFISKIIVRSTLRISAKISELIPEKWLEQNEQRFRAVSDTKAIASTKDIPAFDLLRASVNLTVASVLISFATSLKLPLSTTYVSFMVAMGTSLTDRAWGRSSAVYRISGVINVIGGWFFTAFLAFTVAATFATFIYYFETTAIIVLVLMLVFLISRTFIHHSKKEKEKKKKEAFKHTDKHSPFEEIISDTCTKVCSTLELIQKAYENSVKGLLEEDLQALQRSKIAVDILEKEQMALKDKLFLLIKRANNNETKAGQLHLRVYDLEQDIVQSISLIVETSLEHVSSSLEPVEKKYRKELLGIKDLTKMYLKSLMEMIARNDFMKLQKLLEEKKEILSTLNLTLAKVISDVGQNNISKQSSTLLFTIVLETKDLVAVAARFGKLYARIEKDLRN